MPVSVISQCGAPVQVPVMSDMQPGSDYTLPAATLTTLGGVKQAVPVQDVETIAVTDIQSAQDAIAAMGTTLSELMQSMRNAGLLGK